MCKYCVIRSHGDIMAKSYFYYNDLNSQNEWSEWKKKCIMKLDMNHELLNKVCEP